MLVAFSAFSITVSAVTNRVWKLDSNPAREADFRSLQAAHDSTQVQPGDTLYVAPSSVGYGHLTVTQRLTIVGAGYFLAENLDYPYHIVGPMCGNVIFQPGSEGSILSSMSCNAVGFGEVHDITVKRNLAVGMGAQDDRFRSNLFILQNYISGGMNWDYPGAFSGELIIRNNYIGTRFNAIQISASTIENNVFSGATLYLSSDAFRNNIMRSCTIHTNSSSTMVEYNIADANSTPLSSGRGNVSGVPPDSIFVGSGSPDGQWQLKTGSPALTAGKGNTACGMFGGAQRYVLSGLPALPTVVAIDAPLSVSDESGLPVTVTVRANP
jgi:hypothetical protein